MNHDTTIHSMGRDTGCCIIATRYFGLVWCFVWKRYDVFPLHASWPERCHTAPMITSYYFYSTINILQHAGWFTPPPAWNATAQAATTISPSDCKSNHCSRSSRGSDNNSHSPMTHSLLDPDPLNENSLALNEAAS